MSAFVVELPTLPPTSNNAYVTVKGRRVLSGEAKRWKRGAMQIIKNAQQHQEWSVPEKTPIRVDLLFVLPRLYIRDVANMEKLLADVLAAALQVDDRYTVDLRLRKELGPERVVVTVERIES